MSKPRFFKETVKENGDLLCLYNQLPSDYYNMKGECNYTVTTPFNYSEKHGGLLLSFQYYNNYVVLTPKREERNV